jgi:hypothetical protein
MYPIGLYWVRLDQLYHYAYLIFESFLFESDRIGSDRIGSDCVVLCCVRSDYRYFALGRNKLACIRLDYDWLECVVSRACC